MSGPAAAAIDWDRAARELDADGAAVLGRMLAPDACRTIAALYPQEGPFRSRIVMARHGFGSGEYKYFDYPLPEPVAALRQTLYAGLAPVANGWAERLGLPERYPPTLDEFLARCHGAGQRRPTPLLLRYGPGDYNCLHQDLYGALAFPLQVTILLSKPGEDFTGGEFALTEQRPRMQSRVHVVPLGHGEAVAFAVSHRPREGARGVHRVTMRHGVSRIGSGRRLAMGIIFHDAA